jgi:carbonic anhydrase
MHLLLTIVLYLSIIGYKIYKKNKIKKQYTPIELLYSGNLEFSKTYNKESIQTHTAILSCSDNKTPIECMFNLTKGEIFVVKEIGHIPNNNTIASIEYAISILKVKQLLVIGHTECDAVKTCLTNTDFKSENLNKIISSIKEPNNLDINDLNNSIKIHTRNTMNLLRKKSIIIDNAIKNKSITAYIALYDISTGKININLI